MTGRLQIARFEQGELLIRDWEALPIRLRLTEKRHQLPTRLEPQQPRLEPQQQPRLLGPRPKQPLHQLIPEPRLKRASNRKLTLIHLIK